MKNEKVVLSKTLDTFTDVNPYFEKLSGIDMEHIPEKYGDGVEKTKELVQDNLNIILLYRCDEIEDIQDNRVILKDGNTYTGEMPPKILKDSEQVITFVVTLHGFTELAEKVDDLMENYFLDTWGSAYVEAAQGWLGKMVLTKLREEGLSRTHLWSPGQHKFSLQNQNTVFRILKPEEYGCILTKNLMMQPIKSTSGIMGIVSPDVKDLLLPCDFCTLGKHCPASKRGCAEL